MNRLGIGVFLGAMIALSGASHADDVPKSPCDFLVDQMDDMHMTWSALREQLPRLEACDDGSVAEAFSDFVVRKLVTHWSSVAELQPLALKDDAFREFVLGHIDATTASDDLRSIIRHSKRKCPSGSGDLCQAIHRAATAALQELQDVLEGS